MALQRATLGTLDMEPAPGKSIQLPEGALIMANGAFKLRLAPVQGFEQPSRRPNLVFYFMYQVAHFELGPGIPRKKIL
jgi:hypothetical protein